MFKHYLGVNIQIQSGSPQKNSLSLRVGRALQKQLENHHTISLIDFNEFDIPFINQGIVTPDTYTSFQQKLINGWEQAQLIIVISPEYNWFPSAELVNMLHQLGNRRYTHLFDDKVFAFVGVSSGRGGRIPTTQLTTVFNKIINVFSTRGLTSPKAFESQFTRMVLDEEGNSLGNIEYDKGLNAFADYSVELATRWGGQAS